MNILAILEKNAVRYARKTALIFGGQGLTFADLKDQSFRLANALQDRGIQRGDKVGIFLPNCPQCVISYLAVLSMGGVAVPLDFMLKEDELVSCLGHAEVKCLIAQDHPDGNWDRIKARVPSLKQLVLTQGKVKDSVSYDDMVSCANAQCFVNKVSPDDPALIMYTSGTTGRPKGILLQYRHLDGSPKAMEHFVDLSDQDIKLCALPLSHIGGFIYIQNMLCYGITLVLMDRFHPLRFLQNIEQYKVTCFHIVPPMYTALLTLKQLETHDLSSLRWVVVFGAPSSPEILERFHKYCPNAVLLNGWGMTETCPPNTVTPMGNSANMASVGKPSSVCTIRIVDDEGCEVDYGQIGEIVISGEYIMAEYYKDPELTRQIKRPEGLYTGDLGRFDDEGFLYICGRKKEMIKVAGQIVFEPEVEAAFYKCADVAEAAVIGVPDQMKGEIPKAFVVLKDGVRLAAQDLKDFLKQHLANFKVPREIELRAELPKNRTGKIDKELLRKDA